MYKKGDRVITLVDMYCCTAHKHIPEGSVCKIFDPHPYGDIGMIHIRTFDKMPNTYATFAILKKDVKKI